MVDVAAVPQWLEDAVAEAEGQDVLHGFLAQVMIDAVNLLLREDGVQLGVERTGAGEVVAEGLLDHDAPPPAGVYPGGRISGPLFPTPPRRVLSRRLRNSSAASKDRTKRFSCRRRPVFRRWPGTTRNRSCRRRRSAGWRQSAPTARGRKIPLSRNCFTSAAILARKASSVSGVREFPMMAKEAGSLRSSANWYSAGINLRLVRSPLAPKITMAHSGTRRSKRNGSAKGFCASAMFQHSMLGLKLPWEIGPSSPFWKTFFSRSKSMRPPSAPAFPSSSSRARPTFCCGPRRSRR